MSAWEPCEEGRGQKVLVVEDDDLQRMFLSEALASVGFEVVPCADGESAFERLARVRFNIVVTDYQLPDTNGIEITRRVRKGNPGLLIIGMSGEDRTEPFLHAGANDFLQKPFDPYRLAMMIDGGDILA